MVEVRRYKSDKQYRQDATHMSASGWEVVSVTSENRRSGCMRIIMLGGIGALIWKPKPVLIVTYRRQE